MFLEMNSEGEAALGIARDLVSKYSNTPAGAEALAWMIENPLLTIEERYSIFEQFTSSYPYLIIPEIHYQIATVLLDSLNRPLEALAARERWQAASDWEQPHLDILELSDEAGIYYRAKAYQSASELLNAQEQFRVLLNLNNQYLKILSY